MLRSILLTALLAIAGIAPAVAQAPTVEVGHAWARATPGGAKTAALYMTLVNKGADDDRLVSIYQQASLFVQASCVRDVYGNVAAKTELMGLTTLEAMACGLPVIVSADGGSLPELVTDTRFGAVFKDEVDLASLLRRHQSGIWPPLGGQAAAREHAISIYSLATYGRKLADFYAAAHTRRIRGRVCAS